MTVNISTLSQNAAGAAITGLIDSGTGQPNGFISIWTGLKPATPQTPETGTLLATCGFSLPAFGAFSNGTASANPIGLDSAIAATGIAGWFRVYTRNGAAVFDGDVGLISSGADLEFDNINFIQGGVVAISSFVANMPMS